MNRETKKQVEAMDKLNFHYPLLQARLPDLYNEAITKIQAGVKPNDVMGDWLLELYWSRIMLAAQRPSDRDEYHEITFEESKQDTDTSDFDAARNAMEGLKD